MGIKRPMLITFTIYDTIRYDVSYLCRFDKNIAKGTIHMVNKRFKNRSWRRNVGSNECWEHVIYVKLYTFFRHFLLIFNTQILSAFLLISFALCFFFRSIARSGIQLAYKSSHFVLLFVRCCFFSLHFTSPLYICFDSLFIGNSPESNC